MKLTKKERKLMKEFVEIMEKQDFLAGKLQERNMHKFTVKIFKKILTDDE